MRGFFRPQRGLFNRIVKPPINILQHVRIHVISVKSHLIPSSISRGTPKWPPIASTRHEFSILWKRGLLDSHASTIIAEIEGRISISPDVLLGYCARPRFDLDLIYMVVAPCGAVAPAYGALTDIDMVRQSWSCDCDGAAVASGADRRVFTCHFLVCSYVIWL